MIDRYVMRQYSRFILYTYNLVWLSFTNYLVTSPWTTNHQTEPPFWCGCEHVPPLCPSGSPSTRAASPQKSAGCLYIIVVFRASAYVHFLCLCSPGEGEIGFYAPIINVLWFCFDFCSVHRVLTPAFEVCRSHYYGSYFFSHCCRSFGLVWLGDLIMKMEVY